MKVYTYKKDDYKTMFDNAQNVFFEYIIGMNLKYTGGLCWYDKDKQLIRTIEYKMNNSYDIIGCKIQNINISEFDENKYIGKKYIKIYGEYDNYSEHLSDLEKITENIPEAKNFELILNKLFDYMLKSNIIVDYAKIFLGYKNKLNDRILSRIPFPSRFTQERVKVALDNIQDEIIKYQIKKYGYKFWKDPKFYIPMIGALPGYYTIIKNFYIILVPYIQNIINTIIRL